jgi:hypothetical protein
LSTPPAKNGKILTDSESKRIKVFTIAIDNPFISVPFVVYFRLAHNSIFLLHEISVLLLLLLINFSLPFNVLFMCFLAFIVCNSFLSTHFKPHFLLCVCVWSRRKKVQQI